MAYTPAGMRGDIRSSREVLPPCRAPGASTSPQGRAPTRPRSGHDRVDDLLHRAAIAHAAKAIPPGDAASPTDTVSHSGCSLALPGVDHGSLRFARCYGTHYDRSRSRSRSRQLGINADDSVGKGSAERADQTTPCGNDVSTHSKTARTTSRPPAARENTGAGPTGNGTPSQPRLETALGIAMHRAFRHDRNRKSLRSA